MGTVVDLDKERRIAANLNRLGELLAGSSAETADRAHLYLNGDLPTMTETEAETVVLTIRMTPATKDRLDQLTDQLNKSASFTATRPGRVTRATVVREALVIGMDRLETKAQVETYQKAAQDVAEFVVHLRQQEGLTLGVIADHLTAAGYKATGDKWDEQAVERILKSNGFGP